MAHGTTQVVTSLSRALRRNAAAIAHEFARAIDGDRTSIHRVRVASRRLRAALPVAAGAGDDRALQLARLIRRVTRGLADVREMDVVRKVLRQLPIDARCSSATVLRLDETCERHRDRAMEGAERRLAKVDWPRIEARIDRAADRMAKVSPNALASQVLLEIRRRTLECADALRTAGVVYAVDPLHAVRLATKKLRYTLELAGDMLGDEMPRAARQLKRFQELLGDLHDAQMAQHHVRRAAARVRSRVRAGELEVLDRELELECRKLHARALRALPRLEVSLREVIRLCAVSGLPRRASHVARMKGQRPGTSVAVGQ
jgi:CHAD domain-containing protein